jgi:DNA-binding NtrC family response regulator
MNMPRLDGRQTLAEIRRRSPGLPVIVTSGMGDYDSPELDGDRFSAFLPKPFGLETLAQKVRQLLDMAGGPPAYG